MLRKAIPPFFITMLLLSCAQVRQPSGGPKDVVAPQIDTTYPPNFTVDFDSDKISIEFNEYIRLNNISEQLIVSPRLSEDPEVFVKKGHIVHIKLPNDLMPNSTYTLNFGNSVEDVTEGNKASDLNFVFSTGSYLDSLQVFGILRNAYSMEPEKDALVMLYDASEDPDPRVDLPLYFTKADAEGRFHLKNLRNTSYMIFALRDLNFNYLYDLPSENIAFINTLINPQVVDSSATPLDLFMFEEKSQQQFIKKFDFGPIGKMMIQTNLATDSLHFIIDHNKIPKENFIREDFKGRDTVIWWMKDTNLVNGTDLFFFDATLAMDTITIDRRTPKKKELKLKVRHTLAGTFGPRDRMVLETERPIFSYNAQHMMLLADSDTVSFNLMPLDSIRRRFLVDLERQNASRYQFTMMPGAFEDMYGQGIDSTTFILGQRDPDFYGDIKLAITIEASVHPLILELINERGVLIERTVLHEGVIMEYTDLDPGIYRSRLIFDNNSSGEWGTGDLDHGLLPEKVLYFSDKIVVRSGWDLDLEWTPE